MKKYLALLVLFLTACGASTATQQSKLYNLATLGDAQMRAGDYHGAIRTITEIAASFESPVLYLNRGIAYSNLGHFDLAIADFDKAISMDPNIYDAFVQRANARRKLAR